MVTRRSEFAIEQFTIYIRRREARVMDWRVTHLSARGQGNYHLLTVVSQLLGSLGCQLAQLAQPRDLQPTIQPGQLASGTPAPSKIEAQSH